MILVLGVAFAIGALVKKSKDTPQDMINRIESVIKEVLGDDVKKQTETVVAGTLKYADKEGNEINYHILKTTYYEADPSEVTGLNEDALGVLINPDSANGFNEDLVIGSTNESVEFEENSPVINMYINSPFFTSGGTIDESSILYATISDENGINTTGSGIGHDLQLKEKQ